MIIYSGKNYYEVSDLSESDNFVIEFRSTADRESFIEELDSVGSGLFEATENIVEFNLKRIGGKVLSTGKKFVDDEIIKPAKHTTRLLQRDSDLLDQGMRMEDLPDYSPEDYKMVKKHATNLNASTGMAGYRLNKKVSGQDVIDAHKRERDREYFEKKFGKKPKKLQEPKMPDKSPSTGMQESKSSEAGMLPAKKVKDKIKEPKYDKKLKLKKNVDPRKEVKKPMQLDKNMYIMKGIEFRVMKEDYKPVINEADIIVHDFLVDLNEGDNVDFPLFDTDPYNDHPDDEKVIKKDPKKKKKTNENASASATSAGAIASVPTGKKKIRKRSELFVEDAIKYSKKLKEYAPDVVSPAPVPAPSAPVTSPRPLPRPSTTAPVTSPRPQPRPTGSAPITSPRPLPRPSTVAPVTSPRPAPRPTGSAPTIAPRPAPRPTAPLTSPRPQPRPDVDMSGESDYMEDTSVPMTSPRPKPRPASAPMKSPRPKQRPATSAPVKSPRPKPRPWGDHLEIDYE